MSMLGDIIDAFVKSLRKAPVVMKGKVAVRAVTDDGKGIINTVLPCVAVSVDNSPRADVHIGGLVMDKVAISFSIIANFNDQTAASFNEQQRKTLNLAMQVRSHIEKSKQGEDFAELTRKYNFYPVYRGFRTYTTQAFDREIGTSVSVVELQYETRIVDYATYDELHHSEELQEVTVTLPEAGGGWTEQVVSFSITDIKADNPDLPANGYGPQIVDNPDTWISWRVDDIEFTGVKICESPASNGRIIQMQGNATAADKQAKMYSVTPIYGMSMIRIVFRSYGTTHHSPDYTMTVAGAARTPVETYTDRNGYREYVHEYDLSGLSADSFAIDNNKTGALYIASFGITRLVYR